MTGRGTGGGKSETMGVKEQFLSCKFKLHVPSTRKKAIMDFALREYTLAFSKLLDWAKNHEASLREDGQYKGRYNEKALSSLLPRPDGNIHSSAKESLLKDVAASLASYFALCEIDPNTSFPTCRDPSPDVIHGALDEFIRCSVDDYDKARDRLLTVCRGSVMPLHFYRADGASQGGTSARNRNFSLLWRTDKHQLLAVMYLLPAGHELGQPLGVHDENLARLDTGEMFTSNSKCAILMPLEIGRNGWHEQRFIEPCLSGQARIASGMLIRDDERNEYYLVVSFAMACKERYEPEAYLGIDKGILFTAAYAIVDRNGRVETLGHFDDELRALQIKHGEERERLARNGKRITWRHYKRKAYENILHSLANQLIEMARDRHAQIVVEDLSIKVRGGRVISRFRKLDRILDYKCRLAGVPYRSVFAAYSSQICHKCGGMMERNDRHVVCSHCGYEGHSDDNASVNIARRAMYRKSDWAERGGYRAFHRSFANVGTL